MNGEETGGSYMRLRISLAIVAASQLVRRACDSIGFGPASAARLCLFLVLAAIVSVSFVLISVLLTLTAAVTIGLSTAVFVTVLLVGASLILFHTDEELDFNNGQLVQRLQRARAIQAQEKKSRRAARIAVREQRRKMVRDVVAAIDSLRSFHVEAIGSGDRPRMGKRYVAFDIEIAKDVPGTDFNWQEHRPLGISCAAALRCDVEQPIVWYGNTIDGTPAGKMSIPEVRGIVTQLLDLVSHGYTLLTWNGLGFDLDVLAEESQRIQECKNLALNHVDMMFHVFCDRGFPVALDKAAQALGIPGKPQGMSGMLAPGLWAKGSYKEVIDYVCQDARLTLHVAHACETLGTFKWITRRGSPSSRDLSGGWLTVKDALRLPSPDTSWMDQPISRSRFTNWL